MPRQISKGKCAFCGQSFAKNAIVKHLATCERRRLMIESPSTGRGKLRSTKLLQLLVEGDGAPQYWLHIETPADATLKHLDQFLRDIWVECCGHLSAFTIDGQRYSVYPMGDFGERGMSAKIGTLFEPGTKAIYEYDFGSTTELILKYVAEREAQHRGFGVNVLARNEAPIYPCVVCGEPATQVCVQCLWDDEGWLCSAHAPEHECGEEMLLPVVNSPRVGVCGYTGRDV